MEISVLDFDSAHFEGGVLRFQATILCDAHGWLEDLGEQPPDCVEGERPAHLARKAYSLKIDKMELHLDSIAGDSARRQRLKKLAEEMENSNRPDELNMSSQPALEIPAPQVPPLATAAGPKQIIPEGFPGSEIDSERLSAKGWNRGATPLVWSRLFPEFIDTYELCPDGKTVLAREFVYYGPASEHYSPRAKHNAADGYVNSVREFVRAGYTVVSSRDDYPDDFGFKKRETVFASPNGGVTVKLVVIDVEARLSVCP